MAFAIAGYNPGASNGRAGPRIHTYISAADAIATCVASGYYNTVQAHIVTGDLMYCQASDVARFSSLTNTAGVITCGVAASLA